MSTNVLMPQLGESIVEGTIIRWNKSVGDTVERDEPLFEISTDKVDAEIPSPAAGTLLAIEAPAGETVPVDSVVAVIGPADGAAATDASTPAPAAAGGLPGAATAVVPVAEADGGTPSPSVAARLSPVVRRLAREHHVDAAAIEGTGAGGRVTKEDVLRHVEHQSAAPAARVEPLSIMRRKIAEHMVTSRRTSAHAHTVFEVDFGEVARLRAAHNAEHAAGGTKLTYLSFVARAVLDALAAEPVVNARLDGDSLVYRDAVGLGIAVALDEGLIVPVVKDAAGLGVRDLSRAIADLAERARTRRLAPHDVEGGTFTITNHGASGSQIGMPIINQPQLAILGVGAVEPRPVVVDGAVAVGLRAWLTLGFDHRVIDGAAADRFMAAVKGNIEQFDASLV